MKSPDLYISTPSRLLPRAVVAAAASALLLTSCTEATPEATKTVTAPATPEEATGESNDSTPTQAEGSHSAQNPDKTEKPHQPNGSGSTPTATHTPAKPTPSHSASTPPKTPKVPELAFYVTGSCEEDGELDNWSKNFTPYGSTRNLIMQPDGTAYEGLLNDGHGSVDGMGHSQWHWPCEAKDQKGTYTGQIIDLGPDNTYGTGDDRSATYTFDVT